MGSVVQNHGNSTISASGQLDIDVDVSAGVFKPFVKQFLQSFNINRKYSHTLNTELCLPNPIKPKYDVFIPIIFIYVFICLLIFAENQLMGRRPKIIKNFYPKN
jgi:hypothetical protein